MRVRREKGFRKIEILDPNSKTIKYSFFDYCNMNNIFYFIIFVFFICLLIIIFIYLNSKRNEQAFINEDLQFEENINNYIKNKTKLTKTINNINNNNNNNKNNNNNINNINNEKKRDIKLEYDIDNKIDYNHKSTTINYDIYSKKFKKNKNPKISIIIIPNGLNDKIERLFNSIQLQIFIDLEIIIVDDKMNNYNNSFIIYDKIKGNDKRINIIQYEKPVGKFKKRIDGINNSNGNYLLFIDGDDYFTSSNILKKIYEVAIEDKVDILEFNTFHYLLCKESYLYHQPQLFDIMYFEGDSYQLKQFHLSGKLIKKELFVYIIKNLDDFYLNQQIFFYDESMLLLMLFKSAETFELLRLKGTGKICTNCDITMNYGNEQINKDLLTYLNLMIRYSGDNVPEKRLAVSLFIRSIVNRNIRFTILSNQQLLNETINLYLNCDKISEYDKKIIKKYQG